MFRYDYRSGLVRMIEKAGTKEREDNERWIVLFGYPLWNIDKDGYVELAAAGMMYEHWTDKETRNEYLDGWIGEMDDEIACLTDEFVGYELPCR